MKKIINLLSLQSNIGLATRSFRFIPLDDFSRSKSFFSISKFRPYMVFDSWRFIEYSVKKSFKFCCLFIVLQARKKLYDVYAEKFYSILIWILEIHAFEKKCLWFNKFFSQCTLWTQRSLTYHIDALKDI